jgi:thiamine-monophosphate kinase
MMVEKVHFDLAWTSGEDLGHKIVAINLSDLAAMGDVDPFFGVISLGVDPSIPVDFVDGFYGGVREISRRYGFDIVGGDTVRSKEVLVSLTAVGRMGPGGQPLKRSGARPGDILMCTGTLGDASAGLKILQRGKAKTAKERFLVQRFLRPEPRLVLAKSLARSGGVTSMMDISDGLWQSVAILCRSSGVGAEVETGALPVTSLFVSQDMALVGGEDYELLLTARPSVAGTLESHGWAKPIGRILSQNQKITCFRNGKKIRRVPHGFKHFS